jgi:2-methylisocitrate lyase-like PEP mutase family enzyme
MSGASPASRLRERLRAGHLVAPACWDALSARLAHQAGFEAALMSGFAVSGARLGMPDTGLISFAEMADELRRICQAAPDLLVIGDGDTGYGNPLNVQRTVREYVRAGAAAIMIEDQVAPKKCGHVAGKQVVPFEEARMRVRAAVDAARAGPDILILARTDARAVLGFEDALARCRMFADEGADILFIEAPGSEAEMRAFCTACADHPTMITVVDGGSGASLPPERLAALGYRLIIYPVAAFSVAVTATMRALEAIRDGTPAQSEGLSFAALKSLVGFDEYHALEQRYRIEDPSGS